MPFVPFVIECRICGKITRPHRSPRQGIRMVMDGTFRKCRHCNTEWEQIIVPERPLVHTFFCLKASHVIVCRHKEHEGSPSRAIGLLIST